MSVHGIGPSMSMSAIFKQSQVAPQEAQSASPVISDAVTVEISEKAKRLSQSADNAKPAEMAEAPNPNSFGQALRVLLAAGTDISQ